MRPRPLLPPPAQATTASGRAPACSSAWARASSPMTDWKVRTMSGNGCGPRAEPRM